MSTPINTKKYEDTFDPNAFTYRQMAGFAGNNQNSKNVYGALATAKNTADANLLDRGLFDVGEGPGAWGGEQNRRIMGRGYEQDAANDFYRSGFSDDSAQRQGDYMRDLGAMARGENSYARQQGLAQQVAAGQMARSQAQSLGRSGYSGALSRNAARSADSQRLAIGQATNQAALQEQQAAAQLYGAALQQAQQQAQQLTGAELERLQSERGYLAGREGQAQEWGQLGLAERYARQGAQQDYAKYLDQLRQNKSALLQRGIGGPNMAKSSTDWGGIVGGIGSVAGGVAGTLIGGPAGGAAGAAAGGAAGKAIGSKASDERAKEYVGSDGESLGGIAGFDTSLRRPVTVPLMMPLDTPMPQPSKREGKVAKEIAKEASKGTPWGARIATGVGAVGGGIGTILASLDRPAGYYEPTPVPGSAADGIIGGSGLGASVTGGYGRSFLSDKRAKESEHVARQQIDTLLDRVEPYAYRYKPQYSAQNPTLAPPGEHVGLMAQDLEKSPLGSRLVSEGADGMKQVDYAESIPTLWAAVADLHKRMKTRGK